jgi:hypothetical protein
MMNYNKVQSMILYYPQLISLIKYFLNRDPHKNRLYPNHPINYNGKFVWNLKNS